MNFSVTNNLEDERIFNFILSDSRATIYHHPAWLKAVRKTTGFEVFYLIQKNKTGHIEGLIPFLTSNSFLTGKKIITFPFSAYCDPLLEKNNLNEAVLHLRKKFYYNKKIEIRSLDNFGNELNEFTVIADFCTHILRLKNSLDETFNSFHPTSVRASIRRAEKNNLEIKWENSQAHLNIFYDLELRLRKRLLLPPIPYRFFKNVYEELSKFNSINIPVVYKDETPVAAGFILNFKDTFYLEYTASNKNYIGLYPNHKLFFEVIKKAHQTGAKKVDFGRTSNDNQSLITFKEKWAAEKFHVYHYIYGEKRITEKNTAALRKSLMKINYFLPDFVLELEGKFIYKHFL